MRTAGTIETSLRARAAISKKFVIAGLVRATDRVRLKMALGGGHCVNSRSPATMGSPDKPGHDDRNRSPGNRTGARSLTISAPKPASFDRTEEILRLS
jgi:hypothetical protein